MKNVLLISIAFVCFNATGQTIFHDETDKCGQPAGLLKAGQETVANHWGYSYSDLLKDMDSWAQKTGVDIAVIGNTAQNRKIFELTVTDPQKANSAKHRVYLHARTHPNEVQSFWVMNEMIRAATADDEYGRFLRENFIFHFVPMYNPDGVEVELERLNGNSVNLETDWNASAPQAETQALRTRFKELMQESPSVSIVLNMHSAYDCTRYFVYHHPNGTSARYAEMEQKFINSVRNNFIGGIKPYDYYVSWSYSTPTQYPESWWWNTYREQVMALTYEDMNCAEAGMYGTTAAAMLKGMAEYLGISPSSAQPLLANAVSIYPNPVENHLDIAWNSAVSPRRITVSDMQGTIVASEDAFTGNSAEIDVRYASPGLYIVTAQFQESTVHSIIMKK